jgi:putative transposase
MCELVPVSRASFYRHWEQQEPDTAEVALQDAIQKAALGHRFYGYRRIKIEIEKAGLVVGVKKVRRIMRQDNLLAIRRRKFVVTTDSDHPYQVFTNVAQYLELTDSNQLWVADLTYIRLQSEFVYLAVVVDAWSRKVVGWALGKNLDHRLCLQALEEAFRTRYPSPGWVHHSDRGSQYACNEYVQRLERMGATMSMSRPARPWENGKCESFLKTLKQEEIEARPYQDFEDLRLHIQEFIEQIYNRTRLPSALNYQSPMEFEQGRAPRVPVAMVLPRHQEVLPHGMA